MRDKRLGFDSFSHFYAVYKREFLIYTIWSERSRSARSRGRSARRSATPDGMLERKPERNSENQAGARLERNSGFCRSANALLLYLFFKKR